MRTVTITIPEPYLSVLSKWASVSRTLRTAEDACDSVGNKLTDAEIERFGFCATELRALIPALDFLHKQCQQQLWHSSEG